VVLLSRDGDTMASGGLLHIKLGEALEQRGVAPHIFESAEGAQSDRRNIEGIFGPKAAAKGPDPGATPGAAG